MHQPSGNGGTLHLSSAELMGKVHGALSHADLIQHGEGGSTNISRCITTEQEGQLDILHNGHRGKQVEELENDPELQSPVLGEGFVIRMLQMDPIHDDLARGRVIKATQQVKQRAFARATGTSDGEEFAALDFQGNRVKGRDRRDAVGAGGFDESDHAVHK